MPFPVFRPLRDATAPSHPLDLNALHATLEPLLAPASSWPAAMLRMKQMQEAKDAIFVHAPEILRLATIGQMVERSGLAEELTGESTIETPQGTAHA